MKRLSVMWVMLVLATSVVAQNFPSEQWHQGEVRLTDNALRQGQIKYDLGRDIVQVQVNGRIETYSAKQVVSFNFYQSSIEIKRFFYVLPFLNDSGYKRPKFFEVVVEGKATLLAREYITRVTVNNGSRLNNRFARNRRFNDPFLNNPNNFTRTMLAHRMYIVDQRGLITELTGRKRDMLYVLKGNDDELKEYIKRERLKLDQLRDVARLVDHYNTISTAVASSGQ